MGKLVVDMSKLRLVLLEDSRPAYLRLLGQTLGYDEESGVLRINNLVPAYGNETYIPDLQVDMSKIVSRMPLNNPALEPGAIVNVEVAFSGLQSPILALDIYEVKDGSIVNNRMDLLMQMDDVH
ncbi:hypothetical protein OGATHE_004092 [Ogataea polymorpha]|uniref:Uncharacterized protein n=1 Tax=Ogataea polymorpha TaxID=460523 RepID=A0A9P8P5E1_9ASCO|nr:hypothetical protein OGATHE_004092 [Ogataea polymorpha]